MAVRQRNVCNCLVVWPFTDCPAEQEGAIMALWCRYASEAVTGPVDTMRNMYLFSLQILCFLQLLSTLVGPILDILYNQDGSAASSLTMVFH
jgi:hypothetical protein